jgi:hypothetical protein
MQASIDASVPSQVFGLAKDKDKEGRYNLSAAAAHLRPAIFHINSTTSDQGALMHQPSSFSRDNCSPTSELPRLQSRQDLSFAPSTDAWQPAELEGPSASTAEPVVRLSSSELEAFAKAQEVLKAGLAPPSLLESLRSTIRQLEHSLLPQHSSVAPMSSGCVPELSQQRSWIEQKLAAVVQSRLEEAPSLRELHQTSSLV